MSPFSSLTGLNRLNQKKLGHFVIDIFFALLFCQICQTKSQPVLLLTIFFILLVNELVFSRVNRFLLLPKVLPFPKKVEGLSRATFHLWPKISVSRLGKFWPLWASFGYLTNSRLNRQFQRMVCRKYYKVFKRGLKLMFRDIKLSFDVNIQAFWATLGLGF